MAACPTQLDKKSRDLKDFTEYFCTTFVYGLIETFRLLARAISVNSFNYHDADELHVHASKKRLFSSSLITTAHHAWFTKHFNLINAQLTQFLLLRFGNTRKREIIKSPTLCHPSRCTMSLSFSAIHRLPHSTSIVHTVRRLHRAGEGNDELHRNSVQLLILPFFSRSRLFFSSTYQQTTTTPRMEVASSYSIQLDPQIECRESTKPFLASYFMKFSCNFFSPAKNLQQKNSDTVFSRFAALFRVHFAVRQCRASSRGRIK